MGKRERSKSNKSQNQKKQKSKSKPFIKIKPLRQRVPDPLISDFGNQYCPKGYTQQQFDRYREQLDRIKNLTTSQLKDILKINKQPLDIQNKAQLQYRCADGYAMGRTELCPNCFSSVPRYQKATGIYYCKGSKDEFTGQFNPCQSFFEKNQLQRKPWDNNFLAREEAKKKKFKHQNGIEEKQHQFELKLQTEEIIKTQAKDE